jgi:N6-adenosine-specific RNA methylase IME4/ParB-like chromosome segregation protein Spo0J
MEQAQEIDLQLCYPAERARPIDDAAVKALAKSIDESGLLNPISVRKVQKSRAGKTCDAFEVIAGMHRVKALRWLKRSTITAFVHDVDDLHAELMLIDENLCRNDLGPAERAASLARRKKIHTEIYGHAKAKGGHAAQAAMGHNHDTKQTTALSFASETAGKTGTTERTVQREVRRGEVLGDEVLSKVARTSLDKGEELDAMMKLSPKKRDELIKRAAAGEKVSAKVQAKQENREQREAKLGEKIAAGNLVLPAKRYGIILADWPRKPWAYSDETGVDRSPANHYPVQNFDWAIDMLAPMIRKLAAPDCMLAFWSTAASLVDDLEIMAEAGFVSLRPRDGDGRLLRDARGLLAPPAGGAYRSHLIWDKQVIGMGRWFRDRHELLLIGVRGNFPAPAPGTQSHSIFSERRVEHSTKPDFVAAEIERLWPSIPKIEMFRRGAPRPGWSAWGNDAVVEEAAE